MTFTIMKFISLNNIQIVVSPYDKIKINEKVGFRIIKEIMVSDKVGKQYLKSLNKKPVIPPKEINDIVKEILKEM